MNTVNGEDGEDGQAVEQIVAVHNDVNNGNVDAPIVEVVRTRYQYK